MTPYLYTLVLIPSIHSCGCPSDVKAWPFEAPCRAASTPGLIPDHHVVGDRGMWFLPFMESLEVFREGEGKRGSNRGRRRVRERWMDGETERERERESGRERDGERERRGGERKRERGKERERKR